jgi:putative ABC transport system ATP-binding protein
MPIVEAIDVVKDYDTGDVVVKALRGLDLKVEQGEMVAIMGPSGCGKTTLLNCLSGIDEINSGDIYIEGTGLAGMSDKEKTDHRAKRMGFIFQAYNLLPVLSAVENVELPLLVSGVKPRVARQKALEALDLVGLREWAAHKPAEMSGGQQQRVTIARALVNEPAIIWADEPTGNLDKENSRQIMELLCRLNEELGQTYIVVTHDTEVGHMAHRIVHMDEGVIKKVEHNGKGRSKVAKAPAPVPVATPKRVPQAA